MKTEHWRYRRRSEVREKRVEALCVTWAAPLVWVIFPFAIADPLDLMAEVFGSWAGSSPRVCRNVSVDLRRIMIYISADRALRALWQVPMNNGERNFSDVEPSKDLKGTDTGMWVQQELYEKSIRMGVHLSCAIAHNYKSRLSRVLYH